MKIRQGGLMVGTLQDWCYEQEIQKIIDLITDENN